MASNGRKSFFAAGFGSGGFPLFLLPPLPPPLANLIFSLSAMEPIDVKQLHFLSSPTPFGSLGQHPALSTSPAPSSPPALLPGSPRQYSTGTEEGNFEGSGYQALHSATTHHLSNGTLAYHVGASGTLYIENTPSPQKPTPPSASHHHLRPPFTSRASR